MKEKNMVTIMKWLKRARKLKKSYVSFEKLKEDCQKYIGKDYFELIDTDVENVGDIVIVNPANFVSGGRKLDRVHPNRDVPVYIYETTGVLKYLDRMSIIEKLVPILKEHVDQEMIMRDFLEDQNIETLFDLKSRLFKETGEKKK